MSGKHPPLLADGNLLEAALCARCVDSSSQLGYREIQDKRIVVLGFDTDQVMAGGGHSPDQIGCGGNRDLEVAVLRGSAEGLRECLHVVEAGCEAKLLLNTQVTGLANTNKPDIRAVDANDLKLGWRAVATTLGYRRSRNSDRGADRIGDWIGLTGRRPALWSGRFGCLRGLIEATQARNVMFDGCAFLSGGRSTGGNHRGRQQGGSDHLNGLSFNLCSSAVLQ